MEHGALMDVGVEFDTTQSLECMVADLAVLCRREQLFAKVEVSTRWKGVPNPTQERDWKNTGKPLL